MPREKKLRSEVRSYQVYREITPLITELTTQQFCFSMAKLPVKLLAIIPAATADKHLLGVAICHYRRNT
jgi:hypothetical protein